MVLCASESIHCSMVSAPVGVQCPLTSSLGKFPGNWDWLWYPGLLPVLVSIAFPYAFHIMVFFHSLFFTCHWMSFFYFLQVAASVPRHQPSSFTQAWDWHRATVDPEASE